ncbi:CHAT domain-containing protein [Rhizocola hellebori]|uniref:CHAT domain-containing protein n=1 Tax=Rhizocola hellebori TaxID=1392758 RepID=UPI0019407FDB|nr:CHAT domain-containing protein [Rhizocola hellebori]
MFRLLRGVLRTSFENYGNVDELWEAVKVGREAVRRRLPGQSRHLESLGLVLQILFEQVAQPSLLAEAIDVGRQALSLASTSRERRSCAGSLGVGLLLRFEVADDRAALAEAIDCLRLATLGEPDEGPLSQLCVVLLRGYEAGGDIAMLREAIEVGEAAIALEVHDDLVRARTLIGLVNAMHEEFALTKDIARLDLAIARAREALRRLPERYPNRGRHEATLARLLESRFEESGDLDALRSAIGTIRTIAYGPGDYMGRGPRLSLLAKMLCHFGESTGDASALEEAVSVAVDAVRATPEGHPDYPAVQTVYGAALMRLGRKNGDAELLSESVAVFRALCDRVEGWRELSFLSNLCGATLAHAEVTGDVSALLDLIDRLRRALESMPPHDAAQSAAHVNLAFALQLMARLTGRADIGTEALAQLERAMADPLLPTRHRVHAAVAAHETAASMGDWPAAARAGAHAVNLLPMLTRPYLDRMHQELSLVRLSGIGCEAAAAMLQAGPSHWAQAYEVLEHGRGVMMGQVLDIRADLSHVMHVAPELAERFERLARLLDRPPDSGEPDQRHELVRQWDALVAQIRDAGLPGFLRPMRIGDLTSAACGGPVVTINVSRHRSDAFILRENGVTAIHLAGLTPDAVACALRDWDENPRRNEVLQWLWETVASPVLNHLELTDPIGSRTDGPRVWWSATGALGRLPLHAAGIAGTDETVLDRVVSSYTPNTRALVAARGRAVGPRSILVAAMAQTPGMRSLPGAVEEADLIGRLFPDAIILRDRQASRDAVLTALPERTWIHAVAHTVHTGRSFLGGAMRLHDGELSAAEVFGARHGAGELAFLASCGTAVSGDAQLLPDEAVHLAAAFQLAGYQHVVGSLWPVVDSATAGLTEELYTRLSTTGVAGLAGLLHQQMHRLRSEYEGDPAIWAPYIHIGP